MDKVTFADIPRRLRTYITEGFRKAFRYSELYKSCLQEARVELKKFNKDGSEAKKPSVNYNCKACNRLHKQKGINVDHIRTVVPLDVKLEDMTFNAYAKAVFSDDLQVLCKPCHYTKTALEKSIRADFARIRKEKK